MASNVPSSTAIEPEFVHQSDSDQYDERSVSTASVTSSIYNHKKENGRTYHAYKPEQNYAFPNDQAEQERLDIHYHSLRLAMGDRLFFAPIKSPKSVIDVGTGTGIWAIDVADEYPDTDVLGIDLSPIQPGMVPPNCRFEVMDLEDEWNMPERFDLVHTREMNGLAVKDWLKFYKQAYASLQPGGWMECQEFDFNISSDDGSMPKDSRVLKWQALWEEGGAKATPKLSARCFPQKMKEAMEEAGFVNTKIVPFKMPIGPWAKDPGLKQSGLYTLVGLLDGVSGISLRVFTGLLGWTQEDTESLLDEVRTEWKNKKIHSYFPIYVLYGQKPS